jgi:hypothetical protein
MIHKFGVTFSSGWAWLTFDGNRSRPGQVGEVAGERQARPDAEKVQANF